LTFPKTCFNPTCNCKELKIVREVTLRCSNCGCGVKVDSRKIEPHDSLYDLEEQDNLLFTVVKNRKDNT
tara:strand:- start:278 stop:484 length:207 start_codon:yes stop_codon:yes gene_type:complete